MVMDPMIIADRESKEAHHNVNYAATRTSPEMRDQAAQTTVPYEACREKQMARTAQALAVTVQYLACEVRLFIYFFWCCVLTLGKKILL